MGLFKYNITLKHAIHSVKNQQKSCTNKIAII